MNIINLSFLTLFFLHHLTCETDITKDFINILSPKEDFNISEIDNLFTYFKFKSNLWIHKRGVQNISNNCLSAKNFSNRYSDIYVNASNSGHLKIVNNYVLAQLMKITCDGTIHQNPQSHKSSFIEIWIYGILFITLNNILAILGLFFIPIMKKKIYNSVLTFMVSLAIGALCGTSILILIPDSMRISELVTLTDFNKHDYKWKGTTVLFGLYMFFIFERILKSYTKIYSVDSTQPKNADSKILLSNHMKESQLQIEDISPISGNVKENCLENIKEQEILSVSHNKKSIAPLAWMIIFGDSLHNFVDGLSIGAAFSQSLIFGISITIAVLCEELPHELGDFAVLLSTGMSVKQAVFFNLASAMTCYVGYIIGAILGEVTSASMWIFAIAGGMFLYISLVDMMNNIIDTIDHMSSPWRQKLMVFALQNLGLCTGYGTILVLSLYSDNIRI